jgi:hypothetical protein
VSNARILLIGVAVALIGAAVWVIRPLIFPPNTAVTLEFVPVVDGSPLLFNEFAYANPGGTGVYSVHDFKFYLSNVKLHGNDEIFAETDSYHLVRFDNLDGSFRIVLTDVPLRTLDSISFSIGLDAEANSSIRPMGDLDANGQMAWNWEVGYKFVLLEARFKDGADVKPLVYHIGFDENRRDFEFAPAGNYAMTDEGPIRFVVDIMKIFDSTTKIDIAEIDTVKFDEVDARLIADNYQNMIEVRWE